VTTDNWLYSENGAAGIIGMGPGSRFWYGFADPETNKVTYSIELERIPLFTPSTGLNQISFGGANDAAYTGKPSMMIADNDDYSYSYELSSFGFGIVYQTNGVDSSEYFAPQPTEYPVIFTTNFVGLGLPADVYQNVTSYLEEMTSGDIDCSATLDGICMLPYECSHYTNFESYAFKFGFSSATNGTYMRVPLGAFAQDLSVGGGSKRCAIEISYLDSLQSQSN